MQQLICRDCGLTLPADIRGCPGCAWNVEAENKIDRVVFRIIVPALGVVLVMAIGVLIYFLR